MVCKKSVLKDFAKFIGKRRDFSNCKFIKNETLIQVLSCEISRNFSEHLFLIEQL